MRADFSFYLAHFTSNKEPVGHENKTNPTNKYIGMSAYDRLVSILEQECILDSCLPWTGKRQAVCFTECPWSSLIEHSKAYSPFGIGFNKALVFGAGGGPAYYVRYDLWEQQIWEDNIKTFVTPFWPSYRPKKLKKSVDFKTVDYSHEREWRVPHEFRFKLEQVEFVVVNTYKDMAQFPRNLKDRIGREKFLIMDVYKNIEKLWPVHRIE